MRGRPCPGFASQSPVAQGPYPTCDPAIVAHPTFGSSGSPEADLDDSRLFATHPVTVAVGLPHTEGSQLLSDVAIQPPAGLTPITNEDVMTGAGMDTFDGLTGATTFVGDAAGTVQLRATWSQFDEPHHARDPARRRRPAAARDPLPRRPRPALPRRGREAPHDRPGDAGLPIPASGATARSA